MIESRIFACATALAIALSLATGAVAARAQSPALLDPGGVSVAAYGGWAAWSRADPTTAHYALVLRSPRGVISLLRSRRAARRSTSSSVPPATRECLAVYSRCANDQRAGCHIFELALGVGGAGERALTPPGGGSDHEPAIWEGGLVFLRRNPAGGGRRPEDLSHGTSAAASFNRSRCPPPVDRTLAAKPGRRA